MVADGLGGHFGSERAAQLAVEVIPQQIKCDQPIRMAFGYADKEIKIKQTQIAGHLTMRTTALMARAEREKVKIFNVGDSFAFLAEPRPRR